MIKSQGAGDNAEHVLIQIDEVDLTDADPQSLKVGGFYERHYQYAEDVRGDNVIGEFAAARMVERWTRGAYLVASNPAFDAATLAAMLKRHKLIPAWSYHLIDVRAMALGALHMATGQRGVIDVDTKSDELAKLCGVDPADYERHTAMGDATMVLDWYSALTGGGVDA